ncbi:MAG: pyruvate ferredoxin oxidoreductase subunit gamma [Chloroflexi bacterium]|nr:pyruvate ferredoxin oxidoreductase subunit gamma [Chloroflexota bacterium]
MNQKEHLEEVRWHGRGGQGAVLGASMLGCAAALYEGKYAVSFPSFGAERRGAPVQAFTRISDRAIRTRSQIYHPTIIIVLDDTLLDVVNITDGAQDGASLLINTRKAREQLKKLPDNFNVASVDATAIAREHIGVAIVNTAMLGALAGVTGIVSLDSIKKAIASTLPQRIVERNVAAAEAAYRKVKGK